MLRLNKDTDKTLGELAEKKGLPKATCAKMLLKERIDQILGGNQHTIPSAE